MEEYIDKKILLVKLGFLGRLFFTSQTKKYATIPPMGSILTPEEIENLVKKAKLGNEESFAQIFDYFFPKLARHVAFRVSDEDVEDLTSDVFLKVIQNLDKYNHKKNAGFSAWIFRIANNSIIDFYRKRKELLGMEMEDEEENFFANIPDEGPLPDDQANQRMEIEKMYDVLKKLPALHQTVLELKFLEGFTNPEIADITGKSEGNIRVIQLRALREMKKYWDDEENE